MNKRPIVLVILDGLGLAPAGPGNAVSLAKMPNFQKFFTTSAHTQLQASGEAVGLPKGEEGNSEVGHLNLGAGKIVYQDLPRINMSIADGSFGRNPAFLTAVEHIRKNNSQLHLMGLIGPGGVHSSLEHLYALLYFCQKQEITKVFLHLFTDGRDAPPRSAQTYLQQIEERLVIFSFAKIATISGRFYAMDRDNFWDRVEKAYDAIVCGLGEKSRGGWQEIISSSYEQNRTDEFILPSVIVQENNQPIATINDNDAVIFFNFRPDRARQLTQSLALPDFEEMKAKREKYDRYVEQIKNQELNKETKPFVRKKILKNLCFVSMTEYQRGLPVLTAFLPENVPLPFARLLSENNLRQLHIAESQKFPHVTYFFNGGREDPFWAEDRIEIPSPRVETFDLKPEMSVYAVTEILCSRLSMGIYDFILVNLANPDMVGHTGNIPATIKALEVTDECLGKIVKYVESQNGVCLITADHGNCEEMINLFTGEPDTEHSINPVPFIVVGKETISSKELPMGILADVVPTILNLMAIEKPAVMTGRSLL